MLARGQLPDDLEPHGIRERLEDGEHVDARQVWAPWRRRTERSGESLFDLGRTNMYDADRTIAERTRIRQLDATGRKHMPAISHTRLEHARRRHRQTQQARLGRAARALRRPLPRRARRLDGRRRAAVDPHRPRPLDQLAAVGRERVRARLRRLPAARRPRGRPPRSPQGLPDLAWRLRRCIAARRLRARREPAHRHALHQGHERSLHGARRALDHHDVASPRARRATRRSPSTRPRARRASRSGS